MKNFLKQLKENKKGFTLIEMIVVIAIIGVLAAILVPSLSGYVRTAKESKKEANARTVYTAAQAAVTSLETKNPVGANTYDSTTAFKAADFKGGETTDDAANAAAGLANTDRDNLFNKIKELIGKSNYEKFSGILVKVDQYGAVTQVKVTEEADGESTLYPKEVTNGITE